MQARSWLIVAVFLVCGSGEGFAEDPIPRSFSTGFLPSRDMLTVPNAGGQKTAAFGACLGIIELALDHYSRQQQDPLLLPLAAISGNVQFASPRGEKVVTDMAAAAYQISWEQSQFQLWTDAPKYSQKSQHTLIVDTLVRDLLTGKPQPLTIHDGNPTHSSHAIIAYGYKMTPTGIEFQIGDPNIFGPGKDLFSAASMKQAQDANSRVLKYEWGPKGSPGTWKSYDIGGGIGYDQVLLHHQPGKPAPTTWVPPQRSRRFQELLSIAQDPKLSENRKLEAFRVELMTRPVDPPVMLNGLPSRFTKPGGVVIRFSQPPIFASPSQNEELWRQIHLILAGNSEGLALLRSESAAREERFDSVSVRAWLKSGEKKLPLAKIRGYSVRGGDLLLWGQTAEANSGLPGDLLTVCLQAFYQQDLTPFVSLDPDLDHPFGPQVPRVGGLPESLRASEFTRILLDADYDMKRLQLGDLPVDLPEFRSWAALLRERGHHDEATRWRRFWMRPKEVFAGTVLKSGSTVVFETGVEIVSERLEESGGALLGTGVVDAVDEEAARIMTRHFPQLAARISSFRRLQNLIELALLCRILREEGVKSPDLEMLARRPVDRVALPADGFPAVGPRLIAETGLVVSGGLRLGWILPPGIVSESRELTSLDQGGNRIDWKRLLHLPPRADHADWLQNARTEYRQQHYQRALDLCDLILAADPGHAQARFLRGTALFQQGQPVEAQQAISEISGLDAGQLAERAIIGIYANTLDAAARDSVRAMALEPHDPHVRYVAALVALHRGEMDGAVEHAAQLLQLSPQDAAARSLCGLVRSYQLWDPAEAQRRLAFLRRLPLPLARIQEAGYLALIKGRLDEARRQFRAAASFCREHSLPQDQWLLERNLFYLALLDAWGPTSEFPALAFDTVSDIAMSRDGTHVAYVGTEGKTRRVVLDGKPGATFDDISDLSFSSDLSYVGSREGQAFLVHGVKEQRLPGLDEKRGPLVFSQPSRKLAYIRARDKLHEVVEGTQVVSAHEGNVSQLLFSPDEKRLAYVVESPDGSRVHSGGVAGPRCVGISSLAFSADSRHLVYVARQSTGMRVIFDGQASPEFESILVTGFERNQAFQFAALKQKKIWSILLDAEGHVLQELKLAELPDPWQLHSWSVSSDGLRGALVGERDNQLAVLLDGRLSRSWDIPGGVISGSQVVFSPEGRHAAYRVRDGETHRLILNGQPIAQHDFINWEMTFMASGELVYSAQDKGRWRVCTSQQYRSPVADRVGNPVVCADSRSFAYSLEKSGRSMVTVVDRSRGKTALEELHALHPEWPTLRVLNFLHSAGSNQAAAVFPASLSHDPLFDEWRAVAGPQPANFLLTLAALRAELTDRDSRPALALLAKQKGEIGTYATAILQLKSVAPGDSAKALDQSRHLGINPPEEAIPERLLQGLLRLHRARIAAENRQFEEARQELGHLWDLLPGDAAVPQGIELFALLRLYAFGIVAKIEESAPDALASLRRSRPRQLEFALTTSLHSLPNTTLSELQQQNLDAVWLSYEAAAAELQILRRRSTPVLALELEQAEKKSNTALAQALEVQAHCDNTRTIKFKRVLAPLIEAIQTPVDARTLELLLEIVGNLSYGESEHSKEEAHGAINLLKAGIDLKRRTMQPVLQPKTGRKISCREQTRHTALLTVNAVMAASVSGFFLWRRYRRRHTAPAFSHSSPRKDPHL